VKTILIISGFLFTFNLFATDEMEGTYIAKSESSKEIYELSLNVEKDESGDDAYFFHLTKAMQKEEGKNETSIIGKYKIDKKKIILYGESVTASKQNTNSDLEDKQESKYTGSPIRVFVRNEDNKTILVLSAFGKILKLAKQS
jgi:hypothetical protein